jgi:hypothetical protein
MAIKVGSNLDDQLIGTAQIDTLTGLGSATRTDSTAAPATTPSMAARARTS